MVGANPKKGRDILVSMAKGSPQTARDRENPVTPPTYIVGMWSCKDSLSLCVDLLAFYDFASSDSRVMEFDDHMWRKHVTELVFHFIATNTWRRTT